MNERANYPTLKKAKTLLVGHVASNATSIIYIFLSNSVLIEEKSYCNIILNIHLEFSMYFYDLLSSQTGCAIFYALGLQA